MIICVQGLGYVGSAMCVAIAMAKKNFKWFVQYTFLDNICQ